MIAPSARSVRSVVVAAAVALTGTAAFGQQLANVETERSSYLAAHCDHIRDPNRQVGCYAEKSLEFSRARTEAAQKSIGESRKAIQASNAAISEADCATELATGLKSGDARFAPERGRAILNGKAPREFGYCNLRDALTKS